MPNRNQFFCGRLSPHRKATAVLLAFGLIASLLPDFTAAQDNSIQPAPTSHEASIVPLDGPVLVGKPVTFKLSGNLNNPHWDFKDGLTAEGLSVTHTFQQPGVYRVVVGSKVDSEFNEHASAIVRVHTPETVHLPQVLLDTDARNEVDDQHYIAYGLFSNLDVLGINSAHHGPHRANHYGVAQEPINYGDGLHGHRQPLGEALADVGRAIRGTRSG